MAGITMNACRSTQEGNAFRYFFAVQVTLQFSFIACVGAFCQADTKKLSANSYRQYMKDICS